MPSTAGKALRWALAVRACGGSFRFGFACKPDPSGFLTDRSGKLLRNYYSQDLAPRHQEAEPPTGGILFLLIRSQFDPYAPGVVGIEDRGEEYVTFVYTANLRLRMLLTKKHSYAMQVCPRLLDYDRCAGTLVYLHRSHLTFRFPIVTMT
jgi:hypothetical protein